MARSAIRLMGTETAKESSLGDLPKALAFAMNPMIARSPSSSYGDRCPCSIYCSHPVNPVLLGMWVLTLGSAVHRVRPHRGHTEYALVARLLPRTNEDSPLVYPSHWLRVRAPPFFAFHVSKEARAYLPPRVPCPCPEFYIYASRPYKLRDSFFHHTHILDSQG
ncbi:hypothetical protein BJX99DRAFT_162505 [Aspergillus californicus]